MTMTHLGYYSLHSSNPFIFYIVAFFSTVWCNPEISFRFIIFLSSSILFHLISSALTLMIPVFQDDWDSDFDDESASQV